MKDCNLDTMFHESEYVDFFKDADTDRDGYISYQDLRTLVLRRDDRYPERLLKKAFYEAKIHIPPANKMDIREFTDAMRRIESYRQGVVIMRQDPILYRGVSSNVSKWLTSPRFSPTVYEAFFHETDRDGDGYITVDEFQEQTRRFGLQCMDKTIRLELTRHNKRGDGYLSLDEFMAAMGYPPDAVDGQKPTLWSASQNTEPRPASNKLVPGTPLLKQIFLEMDANRDGALDKFELSDMFKYIGHPLPDYEVDNIISERDKNGDGKLTYEEFINSVLPNFAK